MKQITAPAYAHLAQAISRLPQRMATGEGESVHEGRNTVRRFVLEGLPVMVKQFKRANWVQRISYTFFRPTKARRAFLYATAYRERGIDTPEAVAYIEVKRHGLFADGYFVSLVSPDPPVFSLLKDETTDDAVLVDDLAHQVAKMHRSGILNGDLNLGNFLFHKAEDGHYRFTMVDINRSWLLPTMPDWPLRLKNLRTLSARQDLFERLLDAYLQVMDDGQHPVASLRATAMHHWFKRMARLQKKHRFKSFLKHCSFS